MRDREIKVVGLGFALLRQDNGQQTTDNGRGRQPELWNCGFTDLRKYGITENWLRFATPRQRTMVGAEPAHCSLLTTHSYSVC